MTKRSLIRSRHLPNQRLSQNQHQATWFSSLVASIFLFSGAALVTGGIWLSLRLFVNPDSVTWINQFLPAWANIPLINRENWQTLKEIQASIGNLGQIPGEPLTLETDPQTWLPKTILLPVLQQQPNCQINCQQVVELRVYQQTSNQDNRQAKSEIFYQLIQQLPIEGPEEWLAIAPLVEAEVTNPGSNRPLPLTQLHRFIGHTPTTGVWLYLLGQQQQGSTTTTYGHIVHYNPKRSYLNLMLPWTSPTGQIPQWQQVTGGSFPELVVDETVDLEPQLQVYQVKPAAFYLNPIQLKPISLLEPAINSSAYRDALFLARNGLWSPAWKWLQFIQQQRQQQQQSWSDAAQAQVDLIQLYAQQTQKQAEQTWISPSQTVLADLIDGRWGEALEVLQTSPTHTQEVITLLETDSGRLWYRIEAALQVNPKRPEVQTWGALIRAAQEGRVSAIAWLKQQPQITLATIDDITNVLDGLEGNFSQAKSSANKP